MFGHGGRHVQQFGQPSNGNIAIGGLRFRHDHSRCGDKLLGTRWDSAERSEEHTSELQSQSNLVCRLLLEKKKKKKIKKWQTNNVKHTKVMRGAKTTSWIE